MGISDRTELLPTTANKIAFTDYTSPFGQLNVLTKNQESLFLSSPLGSLTLALADFKKSNNIFGTNPILPTYDFEDIDKIFHKDNTWNWSEPLKPIEQPREISILPELPWNNLFGGIKKPPHKEEPSWPNWSFIPPLGGSEPIRITPPEEPYNPNETGEKHGASTDYANLSKSEAEREAEKSDYLEKLKGGSDYSISDASFVNDIKYAAKGMNKFLSKLAKKIRRKTKTKLVVTSALGTKNSPHAKGSNSASHYNPTNPKIDFGGQLSHEKGKELLACLRETGYFSRCEIEYHGNTCHIDVQVKQSELDKCA